MKVEKFNQIINVILTMYDAKFNKNNNKKKIKVAEFTKITDIMIFLCNIT